MRWRINQNHPIRSVAFKSFQQIKTKSRLIQENSTDRYFHLSGRIEDMMGVGQCGGKVWWGAGLVPGNMVLKSYQMKILIQFMSACLPVNGSKSVNLPPANRRF
jgi:hypothetical protein